ncbi:(6-4)DNA photolyase [Galdieria sulphuraria]|uniref:Deoxyribodipyrimidine photo-lyase n=1 Tax=Galdieria sulphuraria TaxID=130081 RepID=M2X0A7_GALSU|nr:deoxyribodipyrimidine photo-lyase [Galdieria sulphuraria]EME29765.1 deoxyribodipyrimidine photo-lyase [Galdieria sulphuraria]GJD06750.1 (6-4)DNA photolyase [Galdieria sulphuraria]|eukprot:XP_005706285.1 deoxyribodipyrimidine photo-lyase [Galdieria sulphuraria]
MAIPSLKQWQRNILFAFHNDCSPSCNTPRARTLLASHIIQKHIHMDTGTHIKGPTIVWFRKSLRLHDNPTLQRAVQLASELFPLFILDPYYINPDKIGFQRFRFMLECMKDLDHSLRKYQSKLLVIYGEPVNVLENCCKTWKCSYLCFEKDSDIYSRNRDEKVLQRMKGLGVQCFVESGHTLYDLDMLVAKLNGNSPPTQMTSFLKFIEQIGPPPKPIETVRNIPPLRKELLSSISISKVPEIEEIPGYELITEPTPCPFQGGESKALERMQQALNREQGKWIVRFSKPHTSPVSLDPPSTTVLSPYIKCGALSVRLFFWELKRVEDSFSVKTKPPVSLIGQLYWREHFYLLGYTIPHFDQIQGNPLCKTIPWEHRQEWFQAWEQAQTGYPFIDAAMTQLKQWGWLHHLTRHVVACFLTRGDLWISWEKGKETFEKYLIDGDWSINAANWMWLSCSAFFTRYFRVYSPIAFPKKYDPHGNYIRYFLPVLRNMPNKYIYEPWKAPLKVQKEVNCILGKDYPLPIVDHEEMKKRNIQKMIQVFQNKS